MNRNKVLGWWLGLLLVFALGYAQFGGHVPPSLFQQSSQQNVQQIAQQNIQQSTTVQNGDLAALYATAKDAAVRIETTPAGVGSGFVISQDGLVMTAYHVVKAARAFDVVTSSGDVYPATLVGFDEYSDVALLDIDAQGLATLPIDFTHTPQPGDVVLAIGNSRGEFNAPRAGQVVALDQALSSSFPEHLIASTMPLAPGDSGGPVLNAAGEVVGVVDAVSVGPSGYSSFATPLFGSSASEMVTALEGGLQRGVPFMGVSLLDLTPQTVADLGYGSPGGLLVTEVVPGSGADSAGLQNPKTVQTRVQRGQYSRRSAGIVTGIRSADIITAVDGRQVAKSDDLVGYLRSLAVGDRVELTVVRGDAQLQLTVTLGTRSL